MFVEDNCHVTLTVLGSLIKFIKSNSIVVFEAMYWYICHIKRVSVYIRMVLQSGLNHSHKE